MPAIVRWPGKVPAGKVENGIVSGLDWFPTFVAAAGDPNMGAELMQGKQIGDQTYKVHLDGYNQMDLITGKGPSKRHEIFYLTEITLARFASMTTSIASPISPMAGLAPPTRSIGRSSSIFVWIPMSAQACPTERRIPSLLQLVRLRVLAFCVRSAGSGQGGAELHRVPADAKGRQLQHGGGQSANPGGNSRTDGK